MAEEKSIPGIRHSLLRARKKGYIMGIVKTEAQRKANRLRRERAVAASDAEAIRGPRLDEWSARMPAYAYTSLCRMRDTGGRKLNVLKNVVIILWAITGTVNLIQHNINRWDYLMVWGSLMAVLLIWR
mgnify:CR=1 FL=1